MTKARELAELARTISDTSDATAITINSSEEVTFADDIFLADNKMIKLGDGNDFEIYFNGNHGVVRTASSSVTGNIYIQDDNNIVLGSIGGETYVNAAKDGAVTLYYDNAAKLATTSTGIDVTGSISADGGTIVSTGSDAFSSKAVGGYAIQAYQDATSSGYTALDLRSDATTGTRYLIRGYNDAAGTPTEVFSVGADGTVTADGLNLDGDIQGDTGQNMQVSAGAGAGDKLDLRAGDDVRIYVDGATAHKLAANFANNGDISFYEDTGTTPKLFWDASAESLGIGGSPDRVFHVSRSSASVISGKFESASTSGSQIVFKDADTTTNDLQVRIGSDANDLVQYAGGSERLRIDSGGHVMISGTANGGLGSFTLGDTSDARQDINILTSTTGFGSINFADATSGADRYRGYIAYRHDGNYMQFATNATEAMRIDAGGNVGIMTSNPQAAKFSTTASGILEVAGTKPVLNIHETDVTDAELFLGMSGGTALLGTTGDGILRFLTGTSSASEDMRISGGNLLVGTITATNLSDGTGNNGVQLNSSGTVAAARTSNVTAVFNRLSTDGEIVRFNKDGSPVGSIGVASSRAYIGTDDTGLRFTNDEITPFNPSVSADRNGTVDLGGSSTSFKDLYLTGTAKAKSFERIWHLIDLSSLDFYTFYPVSLEGGSAGTSNTFELFKYYGNYNPVVSGTTMLGSVSMKMDIIGNTWGGNPIMNLVHNVNQQYRSMLGAIGLRGYYRPIIWLRGGYQYHYTSNTGITPTVYSSVQTFYSSPYNYNVGPISENTMIGNSDYLGTTTVLGIVSHSNLQHWS